MKSFSGPQSVFVSFLISHRIKTAASPNDNACHLLTSLRPISIVLGVCIQNDIDIQNGFLSDLQLLVIQVFKLLLDHNTVFHAFRFRDHPDIHIAAKTCFF